MSIRSITVSDDDENARADILIATRWGAKEFHISQDSPEYSQMVAWLNSLYQLEDDL